MNSKSKKIISLITIFMLVMMVFSVGGPYTAEAATVDPYTITRTATTGCPISEVEFVPTGNNGYNLNVTIDYTVYDGQDMQYATIEQYSVYSKTNSQYYQNAESSFDADDVLGSFEYTFKNILTGGKVIAPGEEVVLSYALCVDIDKGPFSWYQWSTCTVKAPEFKINANICYAYDNVPTKECPISKVKFVLNPNGTYNADITVDYNQYDGQELQQSNSYQLKAMSGSSWLNNISGSFDYDYLQSGNIDVYNVVFNTTVVAGQDVNLYYALCDDGMGDAPLDWIQWEAKTFKAPDYAGFSHAPSGEATNISKATTTSEGRQYRLCQKCGIKVIETIKPVSRVDLSTASYTYDGKAKTPNITVYDVENKKLNKGSDYTVAFKNNVNAGTATATVTLIGNYEGTITKNFTIGKQAYSSKFKATLSKTAITYNGKKQTPSVTVYNPQGKKLVKDTDYTVKYSSTSRKSIGRYYATVTFKGNYSGSKKIYFTIGPKNPSSVKTTLYGYDDVKVSWSKVSGASGYVVYYKKASASSYTKLKTTTSTSYKKSNLSDGVKYDFKVVAYKTVGGDKCYNAGKTSSITTLKKITGVKAKKSSSKVKISWTNIAGETGYQISQSTSKSKTKIVATYKTTSGKSKTIKATKGKTYYYKVRAYKTVGDKKIYGPWSSVVKYKR